MPENGENVLHQAREFVGRVKRLKNGELVFVESVGAKSTKIEENDKAPPPSWGLEALSGGQIEITGYSEEVFESDATDWAMRDATTLLALSGRRPHVVARWFLEREEEVPSQESIVALLRSEDSWVRQHALHLSLRRTRAAAGKKKD